MRIILELKLVSFLTIMFGFLGLINCSAQVTISSEINKEKIEIDDLTIPYYKLINTTCTEAGSCYLMVFLESKYFNKDRLVKVIKDVSKEFTDKKGISIALFDDLELAQSFAEGKREYVNLAFDSRGKYVKGGDKEFLIFSPTKSRLGDLSDVIIINLKEENNNTYSSKKSN